MTVNIERIQRNLCILLRLNRGFVPLCSLEIVTVLAQLSKTTDNKDTGMSVFGDILFAAFSDIADAANLTNPVPAVVTAILAGIVNSYNFIQPDKNPLIQDFGSIANRLEQTSSQIDADLSNIYSDISGHLTTVYDIPSGVLPSLFNTKKTITVAELGDYDISGVNTSTYNSYMDALVCGFTCGLTRQQLPLIGGYSIGGFEVNDNPEFWYTMAMPPKDADTYEWTDGQYEFDTQDLGLDSVVTVNGNSVSDFNSCAGQFCNQVGGALIVPIFRNNTSVTYIKMYMLQNFVVVDRSGWNLGSADFYNWLFIDDGFGTVLNANGIGMRDDIFRNWGVQYGNQIPQSS
jgi:hypothetical protein